MVRSRLINIFITKKQHFNQLSKKYKNCYRKLLTNEKAFAILSNAPDEKS